MGEWANLIFVIFSPPLQFLAQFLSMRKRINRDLKGFEKNSINRHKMQQKQFFLDQMLFFSLLDWEKKNEGDGGALSIVPHVNFVGSGASFNKLKVGLSHTS